MKENKGFTLIEILAVIIIVGILMIIVIPAVSNYINGSRESSYITTVNKYIDTAIAEITGFEYSASNEDVTYYIPTKCLETESNTTESPYGEFRKSYVVVTAKDGKQNYYYTGYDETGHGILLTSRDSLEESVIIPDMTDIDTTISVGSREYVYVYSDSCTKEGERLSATAFIYEKGKITRIGDRYEGILSSMPDENGATPDPSVPTPTPSGSTPTPSPAPTGIRTDGWIRVTIGNQYSSFGAGNIKFAIYQIAYGDSFNNWTMIREFEGINIMQSGNTFNDAALIQIDQRISDYSIRPVYSRTTNSNGIADFKNLQRGVYYVTMITGPKGLSVSPILTSVPNKQGSSNVTVSPSYVYEPPTP